MEMTLSKRGASLLLNDVASDLVEGWASIRLGEVVSPSKEKVEPRERADSPYLGLEHIESGTATIIGRGQGSDVTSTKTVFRPGDLLYGKLRPYLNKVCIPDFEGICSTDILVFAKSPLIQSPFLLRFLMLPEIVEFANHNSSGIQLPRMSFDKLAGLAFPLPPLAEQQRIVAKVEALLARVNGAGQRLAKVPAILKRFRQSVLAAACSGRLTADWREEQGVLDEADEGQLPPLWKQGPLSELCTAFEYGSSRKSEKEGKIPVLRMGNIQDGKIDWSDLVYSKDEEEIKRYSLAPNTVLFNRTNSPELVGKTAIYRGERSAIFAGYLIRIIAGPELDPVYLNLSLNTPAFKDYCQQVKTDGVSQSNINAKKLADYSISWCPVPEQREIAPRVEALFRLGDATDKRGAGATARGEKLTQAILAKAFRGELVPTEAELARRQGRDYEPASVLLKRIKGEPAQQLLRKPSRRVKKG